MDEQGFLVRQGHAMSLEWCKIQGEGLVDVMMWSKVRGTGNRCTRKNKSHRAFSSIAF